MDGFVTRLMISRKKFLLKTLHDGSIFQEVFHVVEVELLHQGFLK